MVNADFFWKECQCDTEKIAWKDTIRGPDKWVFELTDFSVHFDLYLPEGPLANHLIWGY